MIYITKRKREQKRRKILFELAAIAIVAVAAFCGAFLSPLKWRTSEEYRLYQESLIIPEYSGQAYAQINGNVPFFDEDDKTTRSFESYGELDRLGRCTAAYANIGRELMPTEDRGEIGGIKPSGWQQAKYEGIVKSGPPYLYNRCHLIAYCLTAENANEKNLITGTRYMNVEGMLPFEEQVARYLDENDNHVLYRATPIFEGNNLVASGVLLEAFSVEDNGAGICFCVYCYNVQPGVEIDYRTGESRLANHIVSK